MPEYIVYVKEVWVQPYRVKARTPAEALEKARGIRPGDCYFIEGGLEFSYELDSEYWEIEEVKPDESLKSKN